MQKKILITGNGGFIGKNLQIEAERIGWIVKGIDKRGDKPLDLCEELDRSEISDLVEWADIVYNLAAIPAHRLSVKSPERIIRNNFNATLTVAELCRKHNKKLIHASSFSVYGQQPAPWKEDMPLQYDTPYSASKSMIEEMLKLYHHLYGLDIMVARFSNVFGPFEELHDPIQVLPLWFKKKKAGEPIVIYGSQTTRDFTYVWDVCHALLRLSREKGFDVYNICSGKEEKLVDVARKISHSVGIEELPNYEASRWVGDNTKMKALGWSPTKDVYSWVVEERLRRKI